MTRQISAVFLDLFDTLVTSAHDGAVAGILREHSVNCDSATFKLCMNGMSLAPLFVSADVEISIARDLCLTHRLPSVDSVIDALISIGGNRPDPDSIALTHKCLNARRVGWKPMSYAYSLLWLLHRRGYLTAIVSNADAMSLTAVEELSLSRFVDAVIPSCEVGVKKPEAGIFLAAMEILNVKPERVTMVGDSWTSDVAGALPLGASAIWIDRGLDPIATLLSSQSDIALLNLMTERSTFGSSAMLAKWLPPSWLAYRRRTRTMTSGGQSVQRVNNLIDVAAVICDR